MVKEIKKAKTIKLSDADLKLIRYAKQANRDIQRSQVELLKRSFKSSGMITGSITLFYTNMYNEDPNDKTKYYYVWDGQHRVQAARELINEGLKGITKLSDVFEFQKIPDDTTMEESKKYLAHTNMGARKFKEEDFVKLYSDTNETYRLIEMYRVKYHNVSLGKILYVLAPNHDRTKERLEEFRSGKFTIQTNKHEFTLGCISMIESMRAKEGIVGRGVSEFGMMVSKRIENYDKKLDSRLAKKIVKAYKQGFKDFAILRGSSLTGMIGVYLDKIGLTYPNVEI